MRRHATLGGKRGGDGGQPDLGVVGGGWVVMVGGWVVGGESQIENPNLNQPPISMDTKWSVSHGGWEGVMDS